MCIWPNNEGLLLNATLVLRSFLIYQIFGSSHSIIAGVLTGPLMCKNSHIMGMGDMTEVVSVTTWEPCHGVPEGFSVIAVGVEL